VRPQHRRFDQLLVWLHSERRRLRSVLFSAGELPTETHHARATLFLTQLTALMLPFDPYFNRVVNY
jgi:hypothetical protein